MEKEIEIRNKAFHMAYEEMLDNFNDNDLLDIVDILKESPHESFGWIKGLRQEDVSRLFPLIADGSWVLRESYYCSNESFDICNPSPRFLNVESYKEWQRLKKIYPKGFDFYEGGGEIWDEYEKNYPDFWGDARMFDGQAEFRFGKMKMAPDMVRKYMNFERHKYIEEDELFLIIYENAGCSFKESTRPGICYILSPNKEEFDQRRLEIYKKFKSHIISSYVRCIMRMRDEKEAERLKAELMAMSDSILSNRIKEKADVSV